MTYVRLSSLRPMIFHGSMNAEKLRRISKIEIKKRRRDYRGGSVGVAYQPLSPLFMLKNKRPKGLDKFSPPCLVTGARTGPPHFPLITSGSTTDVIQL